MKARWALAVALLAGCGRGDADNGVLEPGTSALMVEEGGAILIDPESRDVVTIPAGIRVRVGSDPGYYKEEDHNTRHTPPDWKAKLRDVKVIVEEGPHRGHAGSILRMKLRPAR